MTLREGQDDGYRRENPLPPTPPSSSLRTWSSTNLITRNARLPAAQQRVSRLRILLDLSPGLRALDHSNCHYRSSSHKGHVFTEYIGV
jgi:hypothetical protein